MSKKQTLKDLLRDVQSGEIRELPIQFVPADGPAQFRVSKTDPATVSDYAALMAEGVEFDPPDVFWDGQKIITADGFHRRASAQQNDEPVIKVRVHLGDEDDALIFAVHANRPRRNYTNADKRNAVQVILSRPRWQNKSDRAIAAELGVSNRFVGEVRRNLTVNGSQSNTRIGADGREYNTSNIGKNQSETAPSGADETDDGEVIYEEDFPDDIEAEDANAKALEERWANEDAATDGYGRPVGKSAGSTPATANAATEPEPSAEEKAAALPLYQAMTRYGHVGHLLLSAATAWYQLEEARGKFKHAYARAVPSHATGTFFDEAVAFLRIPDPEKWEGCPACKGSMRVGDGEKCASCKGGFTTQPGEGVSADVVAARASNAK